MIKGLRQGLIYFALALVLQATPLEAKNILFVGNSFTFGAGSKIMRFHPERVTDLNNENIGGVPALFATFAEQQGLDYKVSLETSPGKGLDFHLIEKRDLLNQPWDDVVLQTYSTLDKDNPGNADKYLSATASLSELFRAQNPKARLFLSATWTRADQTYVPTGHWYGKPVNAMQADIEAASLSIKSKTNVIKGVLPIGRAWQMAFKQGIADANPYDGLMKGQVNLWASDHYHASDLGYYLEALVIFEGVTGIDARRLGRDEKAAKELGIDPDLSVKLQTIAHKSIIKMKRK